MREIKARMVVVDDDNEIRSMLESFFSAEGYSVAAYPKASAALQALSPGGRLAGETEDGEIDVIITDIKSPPVNGLDFTTHLKRTRPEIPVILTTEFGNIEAAIEAMRRGAFHYVVKPFKLAEMVVNVDRAVEHRRLQRDNAALRRELKRGWGLDELIGKSSGMKAVFDLVARVSHASANVLITGESGTGKETVARAIHRSGPRADKPFIVVNCSAIPESLLENELFARGSRFEEADGGTLFLDEIGDMNGSLQSKLVRLIQDKMDRDFDVRVISATHKDLKAAIKDSRFREDLYYRLSVIPIVIPPLRHRLEDLPLLAEHFLRKHAAASNSKVKGFSQKALAKLMSLRWEGNVRELETLVERSVVLANSAFIDDSAIPTAGAASAEQFFGNATADLPTLEQLERRYIELILDKSGGRKDKAAQILGINRRTLYRKEREYGFVTGDEPHEDL